jgi:hypothetical protein
MSQSIFRKSGKIRLVQITFFKKWQLGQQNTFERVFPKPKSLKTPKIGIFEIGP